MCFKKKYTEEEVNNIVSVALGEQKSEIERENEIAYIRDKLEELENRVVLLEGKKVGF